MKTYVSSFQTPKLTSFVSQNRNPKEDDGSKLRPPTNTSIKDIRKGNEIYLLRPSFPILENHKNSSLSSKTPNSSYGSIGIKPNQVQTNGPVIRDVKKNSAYLHEINQNNHNNNTAGLIRSLENRPAVVYNLEKFDKIIQRIDKTSRNKQSEEAKFNWPTTNQSSGLMRDCDMEHYLHRKQRQYSPIDYFDYDISKIPGADLREYTRFNRANLLIGRYKVMPIFPFEGADWISLNKLLNSSHHRNLFENGISPCDTLQGKLGDCYLIAAINCLATKPKYVKRLFQSAEILPSGLFCLWLCISGVWVSVLIDDRVPIMFLKSMKISFSGI